jgi:poly-beta-1,6-N-acetyl-D-glucosamine synthase
MRSGHALKGDQSRDTTDSGRRQCDSMPMRESLAVRPSLGGLTSRDAPVFGPRPTVRFALASLSTVAYLAFGVWFSQPWRSELSAAIGPVMSWVIPVTLAYIPGVLIGFLAFTLILTRYHALALDVPQGPWPAGKWPPITVIVAAYNEEDAIVATLERLAAATYLGPLEVVLADNNSTDRTAELASGAARRLGMQYRRVFESVAGKHHALNTAVATVSTPLVLTVDADTFLHRDAIQTLIARVTSRPQSQHVCACAGALVAENATANFLTRMQSWDYRLGINGVKRMQGAYNSALVAQGAFSAYWTEDIRAVGGWPDAIGEDIVLTWTMMNSRGIVQYEPAALGFTVVPDRLRGFMTQRSRWARGMCEGIRINPPHLQPRVLTKFVASIDYLVPLLDVGYLFFSVPGVILFIFGYPLLFSWWSMLVIPITLLIYGLLRRWQDHNVFRRLRVHPESDRRGFIGYLFTYQLLTSFASLRGYAQYLPGASRRWK